MKNQQDGLKNQSQSTNKKSQEQVSKKSSVKADMGTQKQQAGYSSKPEQQETKREQENMHSERQLGQLDADKENSKPQEADKPSGKSKMGGAGMPNIATKRTASSSGGRQASR